MFFLKEFNFERQYREQLVYIALDIFNAMLFPRPNLGRNVVVDRYVGILMNIFGNIVYEDGEIVDNERLKEFVR